MATPPHSRLSGGTPALAPPARPHSRAAELLFAAAAHRISVEHWLAAGQRQSSRTAGGGPEQQVMAEIIEAWMTGEDALEVASWHMKAGQGLGQGLGASTCDRASFVFEEAFNEVFKCRAELRQEHGKEPMTGYSGGGGYSVVAPRRDQLLREATNSSHGGARRGRPCGLLGQ